MVSLMCLKDRSDSPTTRGCFKSTFFACGLPGTRSSATCDTNYNELRTHLSLDKDAPDFPHALPVGNMAVIAILGGLHHYYLRV